MMNADSLPGVARSVPARHQVDEQVHHGTELGVLRDLYPHDRARFADSADPG
jgi:hypothetical protein